MNNICPLCGKAYALNPSHVGQRFNCTNSQCGAPIVVEADGIHPDMGQAVSMAAPEPPVNDPAAQGVYAGAPQAPAYTAAPMNAGGPSPGPSVFIDYLVFRKMVVPIVIQVLFWMSVFFSIIFAFVTMFGGGLFILVGFLMLIIGPLMCRVYCELLIVIFRINETLTDIKNELRDASQRRP